MKKRYFVLILCILLLIPSTATSWALEDDSLTDQFVTEVFSLEHPEMFIDLLELFDGVEDKAGINTAYSNAFSKLGDSQQDRVESFGVTTDAVEAFLTYLDEDVHSIDNLRDYINNDNEEAFKNAIERRQEEFEAALEECGASIAKLESGFARMDKLFLFFSDVKLVNNSGLAEVKLFPINANKYGNMGLYENNAEVAIGLLNNRITNKIENMEPVIDALYEFAVYYNQCENSDKDEIYSYLNKYKLVSIVGGSSGNDDDDDDNDNPGQSGGSNEPGDTSDEKLQQDGDDKVNQIDNQDPNSDPEALGNVENVLKDTGDIIDAIDDPDKAQEVAGKLIESAGDFINKAKTGNAGNTRGLEKQLKNVAEKAVEKVGKKQVESVVDKATGKAVAAIDEAAANDILSKVDKVIQVAQDLQTKLNEKGIQQKIEKKVVIDVTVSEDARDVEAKLPTDLLAKVKEKQIDKVVVNTGVAKLSVSPAFIDSAVASAVEEEGTAQNIKTEVSIGVAKVQLTEEQKASMTEEQKSLLDADTEVLDFNAIVHVTSNVDGTEQKKEKRVSQFDSKITISVPYTLKPGQDAEKITVLYLADNGTVKNMVGRYDADSGQVIFETNHFSKYVVKNNSVTFPDVNASHWAKKYIEVMASKGIISGYNGMYNPDSYLTRAEFATMITIAKNVVNDNPTMTFSDVKDSDWFFKYVASAAEDGIIHGYNGMFNPNDNITREEMAIMIVCALGADAPDASYSSLAFDDNDQISDQAKDYVAKAVAAEILHGRSGNMFEPAGYMTKDETAVALYFFFNYLY